MKYLNMLKSFYLINFAQHILYSEAIIINQSLVLSMLFSFFEISNKLWRCFQLEKLDEGKEEDEALLSRKPK